MHARLHFSTVHGRFSTGVEAFSGGPSAVYEAIAGGRVSAMPRASLRLVLNLRHLMPVPRRQKRVAGMSTQETVT